MTFADRLEAARAAKRSSCLIGLDPHLDLLPECFEAAHDPGAPRSEVARAVGDFLCEVIEVVAEYAVAAKPQSAFFEALGPDGALAWERVVSAAHAAELPVIGDVKRGDIGSTAAAYARAFLTGGHGTEPAALCDAVTVNPYLGSDSIEPFLDACAATAKGLFVLVRTSNPSSAEFQAEGDPPLADRVARAVARWGEELGGASGWSSVGAVVGATHPAELAHFRALMPRTPLLLPGYGAQGARARDVVEAFASDGSGAFVSSSRGVLFAHRTQPGSDWRAACRAAAREMRDEVAAALAAR